MVPEVECPLQQVVAAHRVLPAVLREAAATLALALVEEAAMVREAELVPE